MGVGGADAVIHTLHEPVRREKEKVGTLVFDVPTPCSDIGDETDAY